MAIPVGQQKYFESGFICLNTGGTANGKAIIGLENISLTYSVETEEFLTFESNRQKQVSPTFSNWTASASGKFLTTTSTQGESYHPNSGETRFVGSQNGADLLEITKTLSTTNKLVCKIADSNYQVGDVLITNYELNADAGTSITFSIELQGMGPLTKATS